MPPGLVAEPELEFVSAVLELVPLKLLAEPEFVPLKLLAEPELVPLKLLAEPEFVLLSLVLLLLPAELLP